jgi:hypothetical protein
MSGVVAGLIGSVKKSSVVIPVNLIEDASFTNGTSTKWVSDYSGRASDKYKTALYSFFNGFDPNGDSPGSVAYFGGNILTVGKTYSLSFWFNGSIGYSYSGGVTTGTGDRFFFPDAINGWQLIKVENLYANTPYFQFSVGSYGPVYIDDVWLVEGANAYNPVS